MMKIGITGGIGSGKSLVSKIFSSLGIPIYNSDDRGRYLTKNAPIIIAKLKKEFGEEFFDDADNLITQKLGAVVFNDAEKLEKLNHIVHPEVAKDFADWLEKQNAHYILKESAIIFENHIHKSLDATILVVSPLEMRIKNIKKRDTFRTESNIRDIISKQMNDDDKMKLADYVIYNDDKQSLIDQVLHIHEKLLRHDIR